MERRRRTMQQLLLLLLLMFIGLVILSESHAMHNQFSGMDDSPKVPLFRWEASTSLKRIHLHKSHEQLQQLIFSPLEHYRRKRQIRRFKLASRRSKMARVTTTTTFKSPKVDLEMISNRLFGGHSKKKSSIEQQQQQQILGLDLLVVTDYSVYREFLDNAHNDEYQAENSIYRYYTSILNELSKMYSVQRLGSLRFKVYPVGIVIAKSVKEAPWVLNSYGKNASLSTTTTTTTSTSISSEIWNFNNQSFAAVANDKKNSRGDYENEEMYALKTTRIDAYETLRNFQIWIKDNANNLPEHDHAIAMTRLNLERFGDTNAQGIAYVGRICKLGESISLVEDVGVMATVAIAGHELAHSLGAEHDGQNDRTNDCSTAHNYLMVPAVATAVETLPNTFTFSECTIKQIRDHIRMLPNEKIDVQVVYHIFAVSNGSISHTNDYYLKQMCRQIWCRNATQGHKSPCVSKPYLPPLSGTTCGHKMWCINGACVEDEKAPSQEGCKFGDRDTSFCLKLVLTEPSKCKTDMFNRFCCESCRQFKRKLYRRLRL